MAYRIYKSGNIFYIFNETGSRLHEGLAKNVLVRRGTDSSTAFAFDNVNGIKSGETIDFADIKDENGDAYADIDTFVSFYESATGGFSSPQGGGQIVFTDDTQTIRNKTLEAPVINSPTGITADDITGLYAPNRVIYVGKHGNDSNSGTSPRAALLTFAAAITAASALTPTSANPVVILCHDAGIYAETTRINVPPWVDIMACDATIKDDGVHANAVIRVDANSSVWFKNIEQTGSGTLAIEGKNTVGDRYIKADEIKVTGGGQAINNAPGGTTAANINVDVSLITVDTGIGITDNSAGGEINLNVSQIKLTGNGSTGVRSTGTGNITGKVFSITESGSPTGTIGLDINSGTARLSIENLNADTAYDVESGAKLALFCADLSGTELNDGTLELTKASHGNSDGSDHSFIDQDVTSGSTPNFAQIVSTPATITVTANAGTVTRDYRINNFTNSSPATMTITLSTAGAGEGDMIMVRILDFSAVPQTIVFVNAENSTITVPATSNGSTTIPLAVGFTWNTITSKWTIISKA